MKFLVLPTNIYIHIYIMTIYIHRYIIAIYIHTYIYTPEARRLAPVGSGSQANL